MPSQEIQDVMDALRDAAEGQRQPGPARHYKNATPVSPRRPSPPSTARRVGKRR